MTPLVKTAKHLVMAVSLVLASAVATADEPRVSTQGVDLANKLNGVHSGSRAVDAKVFVIEGSFRASPQAAQLTHAKLFSGRTIPVTVRVSDSAMRYLLVPEELVELTREEAAKKPADSLSGELTQGIAREPVVFHLKAQVAESGAQTKDGRQPRPLDRKVVEIDVLTLNKAVPNSYRPAHPPSQSWDQENLKRNDQGCPTAIFSAADGNLAQCP